MSGATHEKFLGFLSLLWFTTRLLGAAESLTETNLVYRTGTVSDAMRESCRLDIHYPVSATNPATVV